ncbi:MAG: radical SAM protein [Planctomycetes bacterium]|nr:radical SAM protein [Planctomycetota bacterium]
MIPIARFLLNTARALRLTAPGMAGSSCLVAHPVRLAQVILSGERRRKANERRLGVPVPRFCILSVTWRCNLDCVGCYTRGYSRDSELSSRTVERVIREANELGTFFFVIVGGEPLMTPGLLELLGEFDQALFFLFTNGTLLGEAEARRIRAARNILPIVSLEGQAALTDARRGQGVAQKVAEAMHSLKRARVPFGFSAMVTHQNVRQVTSREWFDELWQAGSRFGFLIDYVPVPTDGTPGLTLTDADRALRAEAAEKRFNEARPMALSFPFHEYTTGECQAAGRGMIHINADGHVEPCPFCHYAADCIHDKPLPEILASPFFAELRGQISRLPNPLSECLLFAHRERVRHIAQKTGAYSTERA